MIDILLLGAIGCLLYPPLRPASLFFVLLLLIFYPAFVFTITAILLGLAFLTRNSR